MTVRTFDVAKGFANVVGNQRVARASTAQHRNCSRSRICGDYFAHQQV